MRSWERRGWLKFGPPVYQTPPQPCVRKEHPALKQVQAELENDPDRTITALAGKYSVAKDTLRSWEKAGLIKFTRKRVRPSNTLYWLHNGSNIGVYDPMMVKSNKR